ncbi:MAG TPA: ABC transporter permease [Vicinamibacterales bacterium]
MKEVLLQAAAAIREHRFRAGLTMLGIAWGIVTVVILMAYGQGFRTALVVGFRNAVSDGTARISGGQTSSQVGGERAGRRIYLKEDDVEAIRQLGTVKYVSPEYLESLPLVYGTRSTTAGVRGVSPEYGLMRAETAGDGRFVNAEDCEKHRRVAFIGGDVAKKLFSNIPPVGQTIRIAGLSFEVVGVLAQKAQLSSYFYPDSMSVFIPYTTMKSMFAQQYCDYVVYQAVLPSAQDVALRQVRETLAARHRFDPRDERAVRADTSAEIMAVVEGMAGGLMFVLVFIGSLTLMIGGVGVMNIMLVSVQERTREIGVRMALGARRRHILVQFLLEGVAITFAGGLVGIALSYAIARTIGILPFIGSLIGDTSRSTDIHLVLSPPILITATTVLSLTGLVSGLWPAVRASRLDPIESLRYE